MKRTSKKFIQQLSATRGGAAQVASSWRRMAVALFRSTAVKRSSGQRSSS
jgi:hypothetical protein